MLNTPKSWEVFKRWKMNPRSYTYFLKQGCKKCSFSFSMKSKQGSWENKEVHTSVSAYLEIRISPELLSFDNVLLVTWLLSFSCKRILDWQACQSASTGEAYCGWNLSRGGHFKWDNYGKRKRHEKGSRKGKWFTQAGTIRFLISFVVGILITSHTVPAWKTSQAKESSVRTFFLPKVVGIHWSLSLPC